MIFSRRLCLSAQGAAPDGVTVCGLALSLVQKIRLDGSGHTGTLLRQEETATFRRRYRRTLNAALNLNELPAPIQYPATRADTIPRYRSAASEYSEVGRIRAFACGRPRLRATLSERPLPLLLWRSISDSP